MKWSPYLEESCQHLSRNPENAGDQALVAVARISRVAVEATTMILRLSEDPTYAEYVLMQVRVLRILLDQVKSTLTAQQLQSSEYPPDDQ